MAEFKQTVTKSNQDAVTEDGREVVKQTKAVQTEATPDSRVTVANAVWFVVGLIEVLLAMRFVFKLLGANPASGFVDFLYNVTGVLTAPFDNIFGVTTASSQQVTSVFEPSILVAMLVYALIGWGIVKLLTLNRSQDV